MIVFPNAKLNLGLHILRKREDNYHELESCFIPVAIKDALEIIRAEETAMSFTGIPVPGITADNLCMKAYHLLKKDFSKISNVGIHLHKHIPIGAGLGGGSADGAFCLKLLNELFHLQIDEIQLKHYATALGSDCAFFINNKSAIAGGRGEKLKVIDFDPSLYSWIVICPDIPINTAWAYSQVKPYDRDDRIEDIIMQPIEKWKEILVNDFELPVINHYPEIGKIKERLYQHGALYAAMSGSGSAVFGIFQKNKTAGFKGETGWKIFVIN